MKRRVMRIAFYLVILVTSISTGLEARVEDYTRRLQDAVNQAEALAHNMGQTEVTPEHLLSVLLDEPSGTVQDVFKALKVDAIQLRKQLALPRGPKLPPGQLSTLSTSLQQLLNKSVESSRQFGDSYVTLETVINEMIDYQGKAGQVLRDAQLESEKFKRQIKIARGAVINVRTQTEEAEGIIRQFGEDMVEIARRKPYEVIGRENEIEQLEMSLVNPKQNGTVLLGEAGVGKTAVVEGLANRIAYNGGTSIHGKHIPLPVELKGRRLIKFDLSKFKGGTRYRGDLEEKIRALLNEMETRGDILFVDEIHRLSESDGSESDEAIESFKEPLARWGFRFIGATTFDEWEETLANDKAVVRRLTPIFVYAPEIEDAIRVVTARANGSYTKGTKITVDPRAVAAAVLLSARLIPDRQNPDIALALVAEAISDLKVSVGREPRRLRDLRDEEKKLQGQLQNIKSDAAVWNAMQNNPELYALVVGPIDKQLAKVVEQIVDLEAAWTLSNQYIHEIADLGQKIQELEVEVAAAGRSGRPQDSVAKKRELDAARSELARLTQDLELIRTDYKVNEVVVTVDHIRYQIHKLKGVPLSAIQEDESAVLTHLENELNSRVPGREKEIREIVRGYRRFRIRSFGQPKKPRAALLFLNRNDFAGTQMARGMAEALFPHGAAYLNIDLGQYRGGEGSAKLFGAVPGTVGFEGSGKGILSKRILRNGNLFIHLTGVAGADPEILKVFVDAMDGLETLDNAGRSMDFRNCVFAVDWDLPMGTDDINEDAIQTEARGSLRKNTPGGLGGRILQAVEPVNFGKPNAENFTLEVDDVKKRVATYLGNQGISVRFTPEAEAYLLKRIPERFAETGTLFGEVVDVFMDDVGTKWIADTAMEITLVDGRLQALPYTAPRNARVNDTGNLEVAGPRMNCNDATGAFDFGDGGGI